MTQLAAKPALFAGVWFRSRLEASWAAFFEHHAVKWTYENDYFRFKDGGTYLPDFWLSESRAWFEVKGRLDDESLAKMMRLADEAQHKNELVIIGGAPAGQVFGEVFPNGKRVAIDMVRCRNCDLWTFSAMACRACWHWKGEETFDDFHRHLGGPCRSLVPVLGENRHGCTGSFGYTARGLEETIAERYDGDAVSHAGALGITTR